MKPWLSGLNLDPTANVFTYPKMYVLGRYAPSSAPLSALECSAVSRRAVSVMAVHTRNRKNSIVVSYAI